MIIYSPSHYNFYNSQNLRRNCIYHSLEYFRVLVRRSWGTSTQGPHTNNSLSRYKSDIFLYHGNDIYRYWGMYIYQNLHKRHTFLSSYCCRSPMNSHCMSHHCCCRCHRCCCCHCHFLRYLGNSTPSRHKLNRHLCQHKGHKRMIMSSDLFHCTLHI